MRAPFIAKEVNVRPESIIRVNTGIRQDEFALRLNYSIRPLTVAKATKYHLLTACGCGGIGRRARLRI
jgi:hypothetical protein